MTLLRHMFVLLALLMTAGSATSQPGEGEWLSYRNAYRAMVVFDKYGKSKNLIQQHLQVMPKARGVGIDGLELSLASRGSRLALPLDATGRAVFPFQKAAYDNNATLLLNRSAAQYVFRARISIVVRADGVYELADLRAACEQALDYLRVHGAAGASKCVGVRFGFARKADTEVRLRRGEGDGVALAVSDGPVFPDDPNDSFRIVNYRFGDSDKGQLVARQAPLAIAPLTE